MREILSPAAIITLNSAGRKSAQAEIEAKPSHVQTGEVFYFE
jgi:hypothetical protein